MSAVVGTSSINGLMLSLTVPRSEYPRDALVQVTIRVQNQSTEDVHVARGPLNNPIVQVLATDGEIVYPLLLQAPAGSGGPRLPPERLRPGDVIEEQQYVILGGNSLRIVTDVERKGRRRVVGEPVTIDLYPAKAPTVRLLMEPDIVAVIDPPSEVQGPLLYIDDVMCRSQIGGVLFGGRGRGRWRAVQIGQIRPDWPPGCAEPREWHAIAGWVNHPVARIDYRSEA